MSAAAQLSTILQWRKAPLWTPAQHPWYSHMLHYKLQAWEDKNLPFHSFKDCGYLSGLTSHLSVRQTLWPFVQSAGSLL